MTGATVLVKPEPLQRTGSFKLRGATNALLLMDPEARRGGIVTHSSGNHGQACAAAAHMLGVHATIAMPADAPAIKVEATRRWGAEIVPFDRHGVDRETLAAVLATERGATIIPPFDHPDVIAGQGTAALELLEDAGALGLVPDAFAVCTGGGGLTAGCVLAFEALAPRAEVFAVEPEGWDDTKRSLEAGRRVANTVTGSGLCDALLSKQPGALTFAINHRHLAGGVVVTEAEVFPRDALRLRTSEDRRRAGRRGGTGGRAGRQGRGEGRRHRGGGQRRERRSRGLRAGTRDLSGPLPPVPFGASLPA